MATLSDAFFSVSFLLPPLLRRRLDIPTFDVLTSEWIEVRITKVRFFCWRGLDLIPPS